MGQKAKFIIVGLVGLLIICFFLFTQTLNSKQQLMRERDDLRNENASLSSKVEKLNSSLREKENEASLLRKDLEKVNRGLSEAQTKLELAIRTRDKLTEELKSLRQGAVRPAVQVEAAPPTPDAYWAGILKAKTDLEMQLEGLRGELKSAQINNEQLQRDKSVLGLDLNHLRRENDDIKRQFEYNKKVMDTIAQELVREKNDKLQIQDSFKSLKNENVIIVRQLKSLNMRKVDLDKKIKQLQEEKASLERKLSEMQTVLTGAAKIEAPVQEKESVELPPIVVRPQVETQIQEPGDFLGKILSVDRENNFTIIDLGQEAGLNLGDTFGVYREGKKIANIEVIKISKSVAACDITRETTPIKIGDTIK
jgi:predicted nuclease with TOPRIM domain